MKKQISIFAAVLTLLMAVTSCSKDNGTETVQGEGALKITLGFTKAPETKAFSTAKPTTSWAKNIKSLKLVLVKRADNKVAIIRDFPYDNTSTGHGNISSPVGGFTGIVSDTYDVYVVANLDQTGNPHATGTATAQPIAVGDVFNTKMYTLKPRTPWIIAGTTGEVLNSVGYEEPAEIFVASKPNVVIPNDGTTIDAGVLNLTRIVSLLRVRIDKSDATNAATVNFTGSQIRLRRISNGMSLLGNLSAANVNNTLYGDKPFRDGGAFTTAQAATNYDGGVMLTDTYTLWNDYMILPGGGTTTTDGFNLAISGMAPQGYKLADGTTVGAGGLLVWWQAAVLAKALPNGILDVSIKITTPGTGGPGIPPPAQYGILTAQVDLVEWGAVSGVTIDM